ncbi:MULTISPECIES: WD40 repeat domain-containing protein [Deinococcus]|uniref:WD40 repeat domain-containing protein n=1 Tax=Deinococcus rufus TaxID=2136097 RepID=A0ABV7Z5L9_9DEIO|nr:hypothetical protein [Deinococcus sp. AB2017081]WQE96547.1 hypothetical protein U2P90_06515 [Deinococcus sp. AB2017081]
MRLLTLMLAGSLAVSGVASALTLQPARVVTVPGADTDAAWPLTGGRWVVSADNAVMVLGPDLKVQRAWHTLQGSVRALAVSPQGTRVAAMTRDRWAVWDLATGAELGRGLIYADNVGFDEAGNLLVVYDGALLRNTLTAGPERFEALDVGTTWEYFAASPDGTQAVLMNADIAQLVRLSDGEVLAEATLSDDTDGLGATFSPDGQAVVVRTGNEAFILRAGEDATDIEDGSDLGTATSSVYFTGNDRFVYVGGVRGQTYDALTGETVGERFSVPSSGGVARGLNGTYLALGRGVARFNPATRTEQNRTVLVSSNTWLGAFLPDGKFYAGVNDLRAVQDGARLNVGPLDDLLDLAASGGRVWTLNGLTVRVTENGRIRSLATLDEDAEYDTIAATPDGTVAVASGYYGLAVLSARTGRVLSSVSSDELDMEDIHAAIPTPDGRAVLIVPHEGHTMRYDVATGRLTTAFRLPGGVGATTLQATPSGTLAVGYTTEDDEESIALIRPGATTPYRSLPVPDGVQSMRFSPDGKLLAVLTYGEGAALRIYDTVSGALLTSGGPLNSTTDLLVWSSTSRQLLVGSGVLGKPGSATVYNVLR